MSSLVVRRTVRVLILFSALFYWHRALVLSGDMMKLPGCVSLRYKSGGISLSDVEMMREKETAPFAAWLQKSGELVEDKEFDRSAPVELVEVAGDAELVIPPSELLSGFLPLSGSTDTCAVDAATVYTLWGSEDGIGEVLLCNGREYTVTGVFARPENVAIIQSGLKEDTVFPYLELSVSSNASHREMSEFISRYSLSEPEIVRDNAETAAMMHCLAVFPALAAATVLLWIALRRAFGKPGSFVARVSFGMSMAIGIVFIAWVIGFSPVVPAAAIPGRWSDFSFWAELMENMANWSRLSRAFAWPVPDLSRLYDRQLLLRYCIKALVGFTIVFGGKQKPNLEDNPKLHL